MVGLYTGGGLIFGGGLYSEVYGIRKEDEFERVVLLKPRTSLLSCVDGQQVSLDKFCCSHLHGMLLGRQIGMC